MKLFVMLSVLMSLTAGFQNTFAQDPAAAITVNAPTTADFIIFSAVKINATAVAAPASAVLEFKNAVLPYAALTRQEPGCLEYKVTQSATDPTVFETFEHWASPEARAVHTSAAYYTQFFATVGPLMDGAPVHLTMTELR